jgi:AraC-like DNA-binding protein
MMFSHIPVVLLTAKTDVSDSVAGLESGANAYVTKPFSAEYLTALVASQLKNVENVRASLNQTTEASLIDGDISEQDRNFMRELYGLMDRHISEADLNVNSVCEELRISRSKFNYKLKGLTGTTPGAFFRHYKLNLAAKMLKEGKYNVSEIADMTGFSSVSHFSASFKKEFGTAPKDYK